MQVEVKGVDADKATLDAIFSTANEDRHGDVVQQNWDLKHFKKNPVILNSHNYSDATEVVGRADKVKLVDGKLEGKITFAVNENPKAKVIFDLYAGKFLNAFSVGFIPKEWSDKGEILKSELLEVSAVAVPANAMALAKSKGIQVDKLYEQTHTKDNDEDEGDDGEKTESDSDSSETDGEKGGEEVQPSEEGTDGEGNDSEEKDDKEIEYEKEQESVEEKTEEEKEEVEDEGVEEEMTQEEKMAIKKQKILKMIVKAVQTLGESEKVETPQSEVRADIKRLANKAIRDLLEIKKQQ